MAPNTLKTSVPRNTMSEWNVRRSRAQKDSLKNTNRQRKAYRLRSVWQCALLTGPTYPVRDFKTQDGTQISKLQYRFHFYCLWNFGRLHGFHYEMVSLIVIQFRWATGYFYGMPKCYFLNVIVGTFYQYLAYLQYKN